MNELPRLLTTEEAAAALKKTPNAFRKWAKKKQIAGHKEGKSHLWLPEAIWNAFTGADQAKPAARPAPYVRLVRGQR